MFWKEKVYYRKDEKRKEKCRYYSYLVEGGKYVRVKEKEREYECWKWY